MSKSLLGADTAAFLAPFFPGWSLEDMASVAVHQGTWQSWFFGLLRQWAVAWKGEVHLTAPGLKKIAEGYVPLEALLAHELVHVRQQNEMGWSPWLAMYIWASFWGIVKRIPVDRHVLESEAYRVGDAVWASMS